MNCDYCRERRCSVRKAFGSQTAKAVNCEHCFAECQQCGGTGYVTQLNAEGRRIAKACECAAFRKKIAIFNEADIPAKYATVEMDNFDTTHEPAGWKRVLDKAQKTIESITSQRQGKENDTISNSRMPKGLLLFGQPGTGKTRMLSLILKTLILDHGIDCKFIEFSHIISEIKRTFDTNESEAELMDPLLKVEVLGMDELAKGRRSDWWLGILDNIISSRYNMGKVTFFTTNYFPSGFDSKYKEDPIEGEESFNLKERLNARIYSRLHEMCDFVSMDFSDYRMREYDLAEKGKRRKNLDNPVNILSG